MLIRLLLLPLLLQAGVFGWCPNSHLPVLSLTRRCHKLSAPSQLHFSSLSSNEPITEIVIDEAAFSPYITLGKSGKKLNIFGALYGTMAVLLGIIWWMGLMAIELAYKVPNLQETLDPNFRWSIFCSHAWGTALMGLTNCAPDVKGRENLVGIEGPVMFVANHASFMDIPFVCEAIGWENYKIVAKTDLLKIPVLGKSLKAGGHVLLDRNNRRSQLESFKRGVQYLKDGVHLVAFAEGTRSRDGRLQPFKKGAMKMAEKANVPIVPLSIRNSHMVQPPSFFFPVTHCKGKWPAEVVIGSPIQTEGKTDDEVTEQVWNAIAANLQGWQKPLVDTEVVRSKTAEKV